MVNILKLKFRQDFEAGVCSAFCRWRFVEVKKLNLGRYSKLGLVKILNFKFCGDADVWLRFLVDA